VDQSQQKAQVECRKCRYRFPILADAVEDGHVDAQCPSCEGWDCFTVADTQDLSTPDPAERDAEIQRLGEVLWRPINAHRSHPAVKWFEKVENGLFEDDYTSPPWRAPIFCVYRFRNEDEVAYLWQEADIWLVWGWHPLQGSKVPPEPVEAVSFEAGLDEIARL
jgi:hypothetical protein